MKTYHILNGDALKEQFPTEKVSGEIIVTRECLIEGPANAKDLNEFFKIRSKFFEEVYGSSVYRSFTLSEFEKIISINGGDVHLWFEEDLFCQTNLWFVCSLLYEKPLNVFLVSPKDALQYGFGGFNTEELYQLFQEKQRLTEIQLNQFTLLWFAYQASDLERLLKLGVQMSTEFPFIMKAIAAHFDRIPKNGNPGKPYQIIANIIREKSTKDFSIVFQEFVKRAPIYGFGDLQVKRIYDSVISRDT